MSGRTQACAGREAIRDQTEAGSPLCELRCTPVFVERTCNRFYQANRTPVPGRGWPGVPAPSSPLTPLPLPVLVLRTSPAAPPRSTVAPKNPDCLVERWDALPSHWPDSEALPLSMAPLLFSSTNLSPLKRRVHSSWHVLPHRPKVLLESVLIPGPHWGTENRGLALGCLPGPGPAPGVPTQPAQPSLLPHHSQAASKP